MVDRYCIRSDYIARSKPEYFDAFSSDDRVWQPDVYAHARSMAERLGAQTVVDVGSGNGVKLASISGARRGVGLDYGGNLAACRERFPALEWLRYDAEVDDRLPLDRSELERAVIVCADVIEHLIDPRRLLAALGDALDGGGVLILSTPDRVRTYGARHLGPPPNPAHVREWSRAELAELLTASDVGRGIVRLTREHDQARSLRTIEAIVARDPTALEAVGVQVRDGIRLTAPGYALAPRAGYWLMSGVNAARIWCSARPRVERVLGRFAWRP